MSVVEMFVKFVIGASVIISLIASAIAWRSVERPVLYSFVSIFIMLGVGWVIIFVLAYSAHKTPQVMTDQDVFGVFGAAFLALVIIGVPLLYWVYKALRRA